MKLLVATGRTQGQRANDFSWAIDGELVSCKATTTAEVREIAGTRLDLIQAYGDGLDRQAGVTRTLPVGTVVERRLASIRPRRTARR